MAVNSTFELSEIPAKARDAENGQDMYSTRDEAEMAHLGRYPVLKRNWGFISTLGLNCSVMITWEGLLTVFTIGFSNGGPAGLVWGYLIAWAGSLCAFITMAELSSMIPSSGAHYHWVALLAPRPTQKFLSFFVGWLTVICWQFAVTSIGFQAGSLLGALVSLVWPEYVSVSWHAWLFLWAVLLLVILGNTIASTYLPRIMVAILVLHILGFFAMLIPMVSMSSHYSASDVFTTFLNEGGWSSQGLSFWIGLLGNVFAFLGADGAIHMSEEIHNASTVVPRALVASITLNGFLGFGMLLAVLFCLGDLDAALNSPSGFPFIEIFNQATRSTGATVTILVVIIVLTICATMSNLAASSRMIWSFARDRGLPGWKALSEVDPKHSIPDVAIAFTTTVGCALGLINIGSTSIFNTILSVSTKLLLAYTLSNGLLLWRRCTGGITDAKSARSELPNPDGTVKLVWGPWRVPEPAGTVINAIGVVYLIIVLFFSFWPSSTPVEALEMNYSSALLVLVLMVCTVYYFAKARLVYRGPVVERKA